MGATQSVNKKLTTSMIKKNINKSKNDDSTPLKLQSRNKSVSQKTSSLVHSQIIPKPQNLNNSANISQFAKNPELFSSKRTVNTNKEVTVQRLENFEGVLLEEINKYRKDCKLAEIQKDDRYRKEIEHICTESLKKGKLDQTAYKTHEKLIREDKSTSHFPFYIESMNKKLQSEGAFVSYAMGTWKSRPKIDTDIKRPDAELCCFGVFRSEVDICVFMVVYKNGN